MDEINYKLDSLMKDNEIIKSSLLDMIKLIKFLGETVKRLEAYHANITTIPGKMPN